MSQNERARLRNQARITRDKGQPVWLRVANEASKPTPSLMDAVSSQTAPNPSTDLRFPAFANVTFHKQDDLKFDEGGRMTYRSASVELISMYEANQSHQISKAYAVELIDGSIMEVVSRNLSEGQETYVLETQGYVGIAQ